MCTCSPVEVVNVPPHDAVAASVRLRALDSVESGIAAPARSRSIAAGDFNRAVAVAAVPPPAEAAATAAVARNGMVDWTTRRNVMRDTVPAMLKPALRRP